MNLGEQIGPLPLGAWLGVVAGGVGLGFLGRRKRATVEATAAPVRATTAPDASSMGAVYLGNPTGATSMGTPKYATNEEWATAAAAYLIGRGTLASRATNALSHVLYPDATHPTSTEDSALYHMAAAGIGLPPNLPGQAFIPDPPAVGPAPVASNVTAQGSQYAAGRLVSTTTDYGSGTFAESARYFDANGQTTGVGLVDRVGNLFGYYVDAARQVTGAFVRLPSGQIVQATQEQVDASNAANIGGTYA